MQENGTVVFVPLRDRSSRCCDTPDAVNAYWVSTTSTGHAQIDAATTRIEDVLAAHGYQVGTEITYVGERGERGREPVSCRRRSRCSAS